MNGKYHRFTVERRVIPHTVGKCHAVTKGLGTCQVRRSLHIGSSHLDCIPEDGQWPSLQIELSRTDDICPYKLLNKNIYLHSIHCSLFTAHVLIRWTADIIGLLEDGQRPPLQCSIRIWSVIRGRPKAAPTNCTFAHTQQEVPASESRLW